MTSREKLRLLRTIYESQRNLFRLLHNAVKQDSEFVEYEINVDKNISSVL